MAEITPEVLDLLEQVRQIVLSYEEAEEYFPWKSRAFFRSLKGRNFLFANEQPDYLEVTFRLPSSEKERALKLPFIQVHKYMDERGWVNANIRTQAELDQIVPWLRLSYDMNKPFRSKTELVDGETPEPLDFLEQVRHNALSYEDDIEEYFPYGDRAFRSRRGQIFLYAGEQENSLYVNVRLPLGEREYALSLPYVDIPKYIGHKGWVGAKIHTQEELDIVLPWIGISYTMNKPVRKSKAKKQTEQ